MTTADALRTFRRVERELGPWGRLLTADDAARASCVVDDHTTAEQIDAEVAYLRARR